MRFARRAARLVVLFNRCGIEIERDRRYLLTARDTTEAPRVRSQIPDGLWLEGVQQLRDQSFFFIERFTRVVGLLVVAAPFCSSWMPLQFLDRRMKVLDQRSQGSA